MFFVTEIDCVLYGIEAEAEETVNGLNVRILHDRF